MFMRIESLIYLTFAWFSLYMNFKLIFFFLEFFLSFIWEDEIYLFGSFKFLYFAIICKFIIDF